jgi:hypothetical protein
MPRLKNKIKLETALPPKLITLDMKLIETLAGKGLTERQIGQYCGYCQSHWNTLRRKNPEINAAIDKGRAKTIVKVADALIDNAIEEKNVTAQIFFLKAQAGWSDKVEIKAEVNQNVSFKEMSDTELLNFIQKAKAGEITETDTEQGDNE